LEERARLANCQAHQLCYVSLQPIDCGLPVARVWHAALGTFVRVLRKYVKDGSIG